MKGSSKRILIAAGIYPPDPGGPALHAKKQFEYLQSKNIPVCMIALRDYRRMPFGMRHLVYAWKLFRAARNSDIVYAHDAIGVGLPALFAARLRRNKMIVRIGGDIPWERSAERGKTDHSLAEWYGAGMHRRNLLYMLSRFVLNRVDALIVPSPLLADLYAAAYGIRRRIIHVVPNPVSERESVNVSHHPHTIIFASRLVAYKNLRFVIESLAQVLPEYPEVEFHILGDGPEKRNLEELAKKTSVSDRIIFLGQVSQDEVLKETYQCSMGIAPAFTEFNPNYILACLSMGKPFLVSRENGFPFSVPEEFLFDPRNHKEFESRLRWMLSEIGYGEAQKILESIDFHMTWDDVEAKNLEVIMTANGSK